MPHLNYYAPVVLRLGLSAVFIWFGLSQLLNQSMWISLIPEWLISMTGISAATFVILNGAFEVIAAILLAYGIFNRTIAFLLFLHLVTIIIDVGLSPIGIRDIGLAFASLAVAFYGADIFSWSYRGFSRSELE